MKQKRTIQPFCLKTLFLLKDKKVFGTVYNCVSGICNIISAGKNLPREGKF